MKKNQIVYLDYIYFDTSVLIEESWPELSAKLTRCLQIASAVDKKVFLPSVVEQELEIKWLAEFDEKYTTLKSSIEKMNRHLPGKKLTTIALPNRIIELEEYRGKVQRLKETYILELIGRPQIDKDKLIDMAISYAPPFEKGDKGFKDAIILFAVFEHLKKVKSKQGSLIARDHIFHDKAIIDLAKEQGLKLKIIESVDHLSKEFDQIITGVLKDAYILERENATRALETIHNKIERFILDNIEFDIRDIHMWQSRMDEEIIRINKLEVEKIKNVIPASLKDIMSRGAKGGKIPISFDVEIKLYVDVISKRSSTAPFPPRSVKVGEPVPTPMYDAVMDVLTKENAETTQTTKPLNFDVLIEATAEINDDNYNNIELISVKLRRVI